MKASSPPLSSRPAFSSLRGASSRLPSFIFPLLFPHPSCVPIQSIFISLLGSFYSCFHCRADRSIFPCLNLRPSPFQPARRGAPSHFLHLSVTSLLHIPFNLLHFYFPLRLLPPSWDIFFLPLPVIGIFFPGSRRLSQHALTFALSVGLALPFHSRKRGPPRTN